jgi:hypothetical protein
LHIKTIKASFLNYLSLELVGRFGSVSTGEVASAGTHNVSFKGNKIWGCWAIAEKARHMLKQMRAIPE